MRQSIWFRFCLFCAGICFVIRTVDSGLPVYFAGVAIASGVMYSYDYAKCKINECCHDRHHEYTYINYFKFKTDLEKLFDKSLFGQHLVNEHVPKIIYKHMLNDQSNSPLVISFNGWTGSGKSFVSALIAQAMFQKGFDSNFVLHLFPGHYLNMPIDKIMYNIEALIKSQASICKRSLIIVEEIDKFDPKVVELISKFITAKNNDHNNLIFLLLSNAGGNAIVEHVETHLKSGKLRREIKLSDLEKVINSEAFMEDGGMRNSELISRFLVDHYIPFLPLQRNHIRRCIQRYIRSKKQEPLESDIEKVLSYIEFQPEDERLFSVSGCKQVERKTDLVLD